jgi:hypothetical protein
MSDEQQSRSLTHIRARRQGQTLNPTDRKKAQETFLLAFRSEANLTSAAKIAGVDRQTAYDWCKRYPAFKALYDDAEQEANDVIRGEIHRRAVLGYEENVYQLGKYCGTITRYSDALLMFQAKARMPEYREKQQIEHSGSVTFKTEWGGGSLDEEEVNTDDNASRQ